MARPRKPTKVLQLNGGFRNRPARKEERAGEPIPSPNVGKPPAYFNATQKKIWHEIISSVPKGVITAMDRFALELVSMLLYDFRQSKKRKAMPQRSTDLGLLMRGLMSMGLTPSDRSKVCALPAKPEQDGWDKA